MNQPSSTTAESPRPCRLSRSGWWCNEHNLAAGHAPMEATTNLHALKAAYEAAAEHQKLAYEAQCRALLAAYRAELAWLAAGGSCLYQSTATRIRDLTKLVDDWSRVVEKGEPANTVWPQFASEGATP